jgi:fumarate reductase subunit D
LRWKGFFGANCVFAVVETLLLLILHLALPLTLFPVAKQVSQIPHGFYGLGVPLLMIWLVTAVILDRKQATVYDWIHGVGVLGFFAQGG